MPERAALGPPCTPAGASPCACSHCDNVKPLFPASGPAPHRPRAPSSSPCALHSADDPRWPSLRATLPHAPASRPAALSSTSRLFLRHPHGSPPGPSPHSLAFYRGLLNLPASKMVPLKSLHTATSKVKAHPPVPFRPSHRIEGPAGPQGALAAWSCFHLCLCLSEFPVRHLTAPGSSRWPHLSTIQPPHFRPCFFCLANNPESV